MDHRLVDTEPPSRSVATCSCGWRSAPASTADQVERRWAVHLAERRSAAWIEGAVAMQVDACRRTVRLVQLGQGLRGRRREIRRQRMQVRVALDRVRQRDRGIEPAPLAGEVLDELRRAVGCSVVDLWWAYVELGGSRSAAEVASMLAGEEVLDPPDEVLLRVALRERPPTHRTDLAEDLPLLPDGARPTATRGGGDDG